MNKMQETGFLVASVVLTLVLESQCITLLNNHKPQVPPFAVLGGEAVLECNFDLEGQQLYSVKWYKNGYEFYRYLPSNRRSAATIYARPGVHVARDKSNATQVMLTDLNLESTGRYRCEVSTEGPTFATDSGVGDMVIVVLPKSGPTITGGKPRYRPGDLVNVNCSAPESKPAADLFWFINGEQAPNSSLIRYPVVNTTGDLHIPTLGLRFTVDRSDFARDDGDMKLKCTATIESVYHLSNEQAAEGVKRKRGVSAQGGVSASSGAAQLGEAPPDSAYGLSSTLGINSGAPGPEFLNAQVAIFLAILLNSGLIPGLAPLRGATI